MKLESFLNSLRKYGKFYIFAFWDVLSLNNVLGTTQLRQVKGFSGDASGHGKHVPGAISFLFLFKSN